MTGWLANHCLKAPTCSSRNLVVSSNFITAALLPASTRAYSALISAISSSTSSVWSRVRHALDHAVELRHPHAEFLGGFLALLLVFEQRQPRQPLDLGVGRGAVLLLRARDLAFDIGDRVALIVAVSVDRLALVLVVEAGPVHHVCVDIGSQASEQEAEQQGAAALVFAVLLARALVRDNKHIDQPHRQLLRGRPLGPYRLGRALGLFCLGKILQLAGRAVELDQSGRAGGAPLARLLLVRQVDGAGQPQDAIDVLGSGDAAEFFHQPLGAVLDVGDLLFGRFQEGLDLLAPVSGRSPARAV